MQVGSVVLGEGKLGWGQVGTNEIYVGYWVRDKPIEFII